jgi:hypothetical protein
MDSHPRIRCAYTPEGNIEAVQRDEPTWRVVVDCRDGNVIEISGVKKSSTMFRLLVRAARSHLH